MSKPKPGYEQVPDGEPWDHREILFDLSTRHGFYYFRDYWLDQANTHGDAVFTERDTLLPHEKQALDEAPLSYTEESEGSVHTWTYKTIEDAKNAVWADIVRERARTLAGWREQNADAPAKLERAYARARKCFRLGFHSSPAQSHRGRLSTSATWNYGPKKR